MHFSDYLDLSDRARNILKENRLNSLTDFIDMTEKDFRSLPRCGPVLAKELAAVAKESGHE